MTDMDLDNMVRKMATTHIFKDKKARRDDFDDLVQEGWLNVLRYRHSYNPARGKLVTYLGMLVKFGFHEHARKKLGRQWHVPRRMHLKICAMRKAGEVHEFDRIMEVGQEHVDEYLHVEGHEVSGVDNAMADKIVAWVRARLGEFHARAFVAKYAEPHGAITAWVGKDKNAQQRVQHAAKRAMAHVQRRFA